MKFGLRLLAFLTFICVCLSFFVDDSPVKPPDIKAVKTSKEYERFLKIVNEPPNYKQVQAKPKGDYADFRWAVGFKESTNNYSKISKLGYVGYWQFGKSIRKDLNVEKSELLESRKLQKKAFLAVLKMNKYRLRYHIPKYKGKVINGIKVTESGLLAGAHLVGSTNVKRWLDSNGRIVKKDAFGTSVESYIKKFGNYHFKIIPKRKVNLKKLEL